MTHESLELIHRYFDGAITDSQMTELEQALASSVELRSAFARMALLDEKLAYYFSAPTSGIATTETKAIQMPAMKPGKLRVSWSSAIAFLATSVLLLVSLLLISNRNLSNASEELTRMIRSLSSGDRLYRIDVEQVVLPNRKQLEKYDNTRPPKPSLDGARLYLRGTDQFVLMRFREDGMPFVTGSDGKIGWAIAPNGPVRTSKDTQEFNRDLPGHEHSIPLANLSQGLAQVQKAYSIQVVQTLPSNQQDEQEAVLIATKKPGERGPKRIEIQYDWQSGRITQIRFIEMPYGPERLTVRLTLIDELPLPETFFQHLNHQSSDQTVIESGNE